MVLKNFAELDCTYVLPWRDAPRSFVMNSFNSALHSAVEQAVALTPAAVSAAVSRVKLSGVAGQEMADLENRRIATERARAAQINLKILEQLLTALKVDLRPFVGASAGSEISRAAACKIRACGSQIGIPPVELLTRVEELASLIQPVGLRSPDGSLAVSGTLRKFTKEMEALHAFFDGHATGADDTITDLCGKTAATVGRTLGRAKRLLEDIDEQVFDVTTSLAQWQPRRMLIRKGIEELTWLLDGWEIAASFAASHLIQMLDNVAIVAKLAALIPSDYARRVPNTLH